MIPTFHDYSLEPTITKCGDLLYFEINWPLKEKVSHLYLKNWGEMWMFKKHNPTLLNNLKKYFHVICLKVIPKLFKMKCLILCDELLYSFMTITILLIIEGCPDRLILQFMVKPYILLKNLFHWVFSNFYKDKHGHDFFDLRGHGGC